MVSSKIAVIDYGSGNLRSVVNALRAAAHESDQNYEITLVKTGDELLACDGVVLPGVGHFADCRQNLKQADGLEEALEWMVHHKARPFLGICVGMQMLATTGHEGKAIDGLGWVAGHVTKLEAAQGLKIPHMGWNHLVFETRHDVTQLMSDAPQVYFVHSYHFKSDDKSHVIANCAYGQTVCAMIAKDTMIGTQFHPEKSQAEGQAFLRGFLQWRP